AELSRAADAVNTALTEMTGATSPRLHLELMAARILVPASDDSQRGTLARVERLERRIGVEGAAAASTRPVVEPAETRAASSPAAPGTVSIEQLRNAWPEILEVVQRVRMSAWTVVYTAQARALDGDVLTLSFVSQNDVDSFKQPQGAGEGVSEVLRAAIVEVLGLRVKFIARADAAPGEPTPPPAEVEAPPAPEEEGWAVAVIPDAAPQEPAEPVAPVRAVAASAPTAAEPTRYGESVVRELLGASFIEEQPIAPRVTPQPKDD
ncbi:MAG: hypothetical protein WA006_08165, partial [Rhodoglobus sp.]